MCTHERHPLPPHAYFCTSGHPLFQSSQINWTTLIKYHVNSYKYHENKKKTRGRGKTEILAPTGRKAAMQALPLLLSRNLREGRDVYIHTYTQRDTDRKSVV